MFRETRWGGNGVIGDGIIATMDTYDQRVYAIGKGPTKVTATASPKVSAFSSSILVEGYVTDKSPGTEDYGLKVDITRQALARGESACLAQEEKMMSGASYDGASGCPNPAS